MLTVEDYAKVRRAHRDGMGIREIARTLHHLAPHGKGTWARLRQRFRKFASSVARPSAASSSAMRFSADLCGFLLTGLKLEDDAFLELGCELAGCHLVALSQRLFHLCATITPPPYPTVRASLLSRIWGAPGSFCSQR